MSKAHQSTAKASADLVYVNDVDAKKFYQLDKHDAQLLESNDRFIVNQHLLTVKDVKRTRGGDRTVTLKDGRVFDPSHVFTITHEPRHNLDNGGNNDLTIFRPRKGF